jgi:transposase-like protein
MSECPYCQATTKQNKNGKNDSGSQRYRCGICQRRYTPEPKENGYSDTLRQQAVKLAADGLSFRRIARHLGVDHVTVMLWVKAYTDQLPAAPLPAEKPLHIVEMDELYTFIGKKKTGSTS